MAEYSDTRDEVMAEPSLRKYLLEKTVDEFRTRINRRYPLPPLFTLVGSLVILVLCLVFEQTEAMLAFLAIFILQGFWMVGAVWRRAALKIDETCEGIRCGTPPETVRQLLTNRLQWWSHLIVPTQWGPNSRLLGHVQRVETHLTELETKHHSCQLPEPVKAPKISAVQQLISATPPPEPPPEPEVQPLPAIDVEAILPHLATLAQRLTYEAKLNENTNLQERLVLECGLYQAILARAQGMVDTLKMIERLGDALRQIDGSNLAEYLNQATDLLHERRRLVDEVDTIGPEEFMVLTAIHKFQDPEPSPETDEQQA